MSPVLLRQRLIPYARPAFVLTALVALVYWPVARFGFLNWDDPWYVVDNPLIKSWSPSNLLAVATEPCSKNFAPLTIFGLLLQHTVFKLWAGGYHVVNAAIHAANALLVFSLVRQVTRSKWIGWFTAILFAVHPIQVETVAWVSSLKSLLAAFFMFASLICWLRLERSARQEGFGLLWLALALLSKASAVVVPAIVLLYDVLIAGKKFSEALTRQIVPGLFCLMALFLNMHAQSQLWGGTRSHYDWGLFRILAVDSVIVWRYLRMLMAPYDLSVMYDVSGNDPWIPAALATTAWLAVTAIVWRVRKSRPLAAWAYAVWFLLLFPVLNIFPITTLMNDRYLYVPCVLVFAGVGAAIQSVAGRIAWTSASHAAIEAGRMAGSKALRRRFAVGTVVAMVLIFATGAYTSMTQRYLSVWRDPQSLWRHAVERSPGMPVVRIQWALTLHDAGRTEDAAKELQSVLNSGRADEADRKRIERLLSEWTAGQAVVAR
jgi:protein O-mannosyl-transferase